MELHLPVFRLLRYFLEMINAEQLFAIFDYNIVALSLEFNPTEMIWIYQVIVPWGLRLVP